MTSLAIIQIIYLVINIIGTVVGLVWLWTTFEVSLINKFLIYSSKRWVQVIMSIFESMLLVLFIPAITVLTLFSLFFVVVGSNFGE